MSISGISGGGYGYGYSSSINNLLQLSSLKSTSSYSALSAVNRVSSTSSNTSAYASVTSFLKDYQSELTGLEAAAAKLQTRMDGNIFTQLEAGSSDESVATAKRAWRLDEDMDIDLEVHSIAQAQKNVSDASYAADLADEDLKFEISGPKGSQTISISKMNENGTRKTYNQMYKEAAKAVNESSSRTGVKASVETENGKVSLALAGKDTGAANGFTVTAKTEAAASLESVKTEAADASYTVTQNGESRTLSSDTNKISVGYGRIDVELKKEGSTNIYTGINGDDIADAVQDLLDSYNSVTNMLEQNSGRGSGAAAHLSSFQRGMGHEKTMASLGITKNKSGDLVLDRDKLFEALEKDYDFAVETLGGQFGLAENASQKADRALSDPVQRIVSNDLGGGSSSKSSSSSSGNASSAASSAGLGSQFTYFANFASSGAYNLANYYAVGMLLNTMA